MSFGTASSKITIIAAARETRAQFSSLAGCVKKRIDVNYLRSYWPNLLLFLGGIFGEARRCARITSGFWSWRPPPPPPPLNNEFSPVPSISLAVLCFVLFRRFLGFFGVCWSGRDRIVCICCRVLPSVGGVGATLIDPGRAGTEAFVAAREGATVC